MGELINLNGQLSGEIPDSITRDVELENAIANHVTLDNPHPSLWTRILDSFLALSGGQQILKNNPATSFLSFFGGRNHVELATNDGSNPAVGFHRGGISATTLYHAGYGDDSLHIINADGYQSPLLHNSNHVFDTTMHGVRTALLGMTTPARLNDLSFVSIGAINPDKILGITGVVVITSGTNKAVVFPGGGGGVQQTYHLSVSNGLVVCRTTSDSTSVLGLPVKVTIWYQP
jgi:hypothetical protein